MPLTILNVAYPLAPVGPDAVGGAEQVLTALDAALVEAGHRSVVVACDGSVTRDVLISTPRVPGPLDDSARVTAQGRHRAAIHLALATHRVDLIHTHGIDFDTYLPPPGVPLLATLHLPPEWYAPALFRSGRPDTYFQCVSTIQHRSCPPSNVPLLDPVANGVPLDRLRRGTHKAAFALVLSRVCEEKGMHLAVEAARLAGVPLVLAGQVFPYPAHQRYFDDVLAPTLDGSRVRFVGAVGLARKRRLLALARCLLVPSLAPETSSLVAMESLACGTPVVAFRTGALVDIVEHGRTGFIVDTIEEMAYALANLGSIDPAACRRAAEERFAARRMAAQYLTLYSRLARRPRVKVHEQHAPFEVEAVTSTADLEALRDEWLDLWRRCPTATVFQHPDWLIRWCKPFGVSAPWALFVRHAGLLVGVVPLLIYQRGTDRVLTLMGAGISDDQDVLVDPAAPQALDIALAYAHAHHERWDVWDFENLNATSPLRHEHERPDWSGGRCVLHDTRFALTLPQGIDGLTNVVPKRMLKQIAYLRRLVIRDNLPVSVEEAQPSTCNILFDEFARLHRLRWATRGEPGMLGVAIEQFHRDLAVVLMRQGLLRLYLLRLGPHAAAAFYGFSAKGQTVYYLGGFDPAFSHYSPGALIVAHAIERAIAADGDDTFDFLRGGESYKMAWGATAQPLYRWSKRCP